MADNPHGSHPEKKACLIIRQAANYLKVKFISQLTQKKNYRPMMCRCNSLVLAILAWSLSWTKAVRRSWRR